MKFIWGIVVIALITTFTLLNQYSFYSPDFDWINCKDKESCLHETGHRLDFQLGSISKKKEFHLAVKVYLSILWNYPEFRDSFSNHFINYSGITQPLEDENRLLFIGNGSWGGFSELYADIYTWSGGNIESIPAIFRGFYRKE